MPRGDHQGRERVVDGAPPSPRRPPGSIQNGHVQGIIIRSHFVLLHSVGREGHAASDEPLNRTQTVGTPSPLHRRYRPSFPFRASVGARNGAYTDFRGARTVLLLLFARKDRARIVAPVALARVAPFAQLGSFLRTRDDSTKSDAGSADRYIAARDALLQKRRVSVRFRASRREHACKPRVDARPRPTPTCHAV